ncbi:MAG: hypothetical protein A2X22_10495 [Bacteroidetes bacterium GWF2_49_14]|nr:MAG: hypothetical protein A2X22_10495 [Bacteroidetes bacterium GWF2_49_14]HBB92435.1 hypothetical protein [Bacteroidales bacterium]
MKVEISNGELLDKLSILEIKLSKIENPDKRGNILAEYDLISTLSSEIAALVPGLLSELRGVNLRLWETEDVIRNYEACQDFGEGFIEAARSVYLLNDQRAAIKKQINLQTGSALHEEKSYSGY